MGIIGWLILGGVAGWVASMIMGTDKQQGVIANIVVGIIGAMLGGFIMHLVGDEPNFAFNISSFLVALLGAVVLLFLYKLVSSKGRS